MTFITKKTLEKTQKYMRSQPAEYYCSLSEDDIDTKLANIYESITNKTISEKSC